MEWLRKILRISSGERTQSPAASGEARSGSTVEELRESYSILVEDAAFDRIRLRLAGKIYMDNAELVRNDLLRIVKSHPMKNVVLDLAGMEYFDSSGIAIVMETFRVSEQLMNSVKLTNVPPRIRSFLEAVPVDHSAGPGILQPRSDPRVLVQLGEGAIKLHKNTIDMLAFIGASVEALVFDTFYPGKVKWDRLWKLIERAGADAVPIVTILSFLMGGILAFQGAIQLRKFGANIFIADLVSLSICIEMGPLLTSLIVSGRSGAAYAAHIGTMQVNEEIDALRVMAIDPIRYLVSPRIIAVALVLPCLTLIADLAGIVGGCVVAVISLDLTPTGYFNQVHKVLEATDILKGLSKSVVYGIEIAMIGCLRGFQVRGGAESVGTATTSAVVTCIFILTLTNAVFAVVFHYGAPLWQLF